MPPGSATRRTETRPRRRASLFNDLRRPRRKRSRRDTLSRDCRLETYNQPREKNAHLADRRASGVGCGGWPRADAESAESESAESESSESKSGESESGH